MLNQFLSGRYKVIQTLEEGGLAQTYIAEDHHRPSRPKCVVKLLKPASKEPKFLHTATRLFDKEAEILEKLGEHPQIPRLLAHFKENQEFYIIQEFIDGYTLSTELPSGHCWSERKVISMLQDVLQTLEFVHSYRVIHRDIKPNNLIRRKKDSRLVLIDFGAVKEVGNLRILPNAPTTKKTISIGTQGYMPTEQVRGKPRLNSDIYALGMIGIQALTGVDPINLQEDNEGEVIWQNKAKVSQELAAILNKMVRYHFKDRYQSVTEVLQELELLINYHRVTQSNSVATRVVSESSSQAKLRETTVSLEAEQLKVKAIAQIPHQVAKVASQPELKATQISLDRGKQNVKAIAQTSHPATKVVLQPELPQSEVILQPELKATKISLDTEKPNVKVVTQTTPSATKVVPKPELQKTKVSLATEQSNIEAVTQTHQTKVTFKSKSPLAEVTTKREKKVNLVYLAILLKILQNLDRHSATKIVPKPELRETKVDLDAEQSNFKAVTQTPQTKVTFNSKSSLAEVTTKREKKVNLVYLTILLKIFQNLDRRSLSQQQFEKKAVALIYQPETKVNSKPKLSTLEIVNSNNQQVSLVYLTTLLKIFQNLDLNFFNFNFNPTFVTPRKSQLLIGAGAISLMMTLFAASSYLNQRKAYLQAKQKFQDIEELKTTKNFPECVQQAKVFPQDYVKLNSQLATLLLECRQGEAKVQIAEAKKLAEQSKLKDAIAFAAKIPQDMSAYKDAQQLILQWSSKIWQIASNQYQQGKLEEAKAIAKSVPAVSPLAQKVETTIKQWDQEWQQDREYLQTAQQKLDESLWQDAILAAKKVSENAHSQKQSEQIIQKAEVEIAALEAISRRITYRKTTQRKTDKNRRTRKVYRSSSTTPASKPLIPAHNPKFNPAHNSKGDWVKERLEREN